MMASLNGITFPNYWFFVREIRRAPVTIHDIHGATILKTLIFP